MKIEEIENGIKITTPKKENYTLADLKQNLINKLNDNVGNLCRYQTEIELLKIILDYENDKSANWQNSVYATNLEIKKSSIKD